MHAEKRNAAFTGTDQPRLTGIFYRQALRCHGIPLAIKEEEPNAVTYTAKLQQVIEQNLILTLIRTGTHSDLF